MTIACKFSAAFLSLFVMLYTVSLSALEVDKLKPGVVKITAEAHGLRKVGTGFIVQLMRDVAYIVTASHVVEGDKNPKVEFFTRRNIPISASVVGLEGGDPRGLALLLVKGEKNLPAGLSALSLAESDHLESRDELITIGHPKMAGHWSMIEGRFVSRKGRDIIFSAYIDEGNSGGPVVKGGQVVGLVTGKAEPYGRATPAAIVRLFLEGWGVKPMEDIPVQDIAAALKGIFGRMEQAFKKGDRALYQAQWHPEGYVANLVGGSGGPGVEVFDQGTHKGWFLKPKADPVIGLKRGGGNAYIVSCYVWSWKKNTPVDAVDVAVVRHGGSWVALGAGEDVEEVEALVQRFLSGAPLKPPEER